MKKIILIVVLSLLFSCKTKAPTITNPNKEDPKVVTDSPIDIIKDETVKTETAKFVVVSKSEVSASKTALSYSLGKRLLESCSTSNFKQFTTKEATEKVIQSTTIENVSTVCKKINIRNGKFKALTLLDITYDIENNSYQYRYNIEFEKKYFKRELFITINEEGKMSSLKTKEIIKGPM